MTNDRTPFLDSTPGFLLAMAAAILLSLLVVSQCSDKPTVNNGCGEQGSIYTCVAIIQ